MFFRRRSSSITGSPSSAASPGQPVVGVLEAAARQHRAALLHRGDDLLSVARVERTDIASVDGRHGRHVARTEALELADVGVLELLLLGLLLDRLQHSLGLAERA